MYNSNEIVTELKRIIDIDMFESAVLSNPIKKGDDFGTKLKITKISLKDNMCFQFSEFVGKKVLHKNYAPNEVIEKLISKMGGKLQAVLNNIKQVCHGAYEQKKAVFTHRCERKFECLLCCKGTQQNKKLHTTRR